MKLNKDLINKLGKQDNDPFLNLYFEKDMENYGKGIVSHPKGFKWDREKSNENFEKYGFSFYLALNICKGYTVLLLDHSLRTTSGGALYRDHGYLFEKKDAGVVEFFWDLENDNFLDCIFIEEARVVDNDFCEEYINPKITEWTNLYGKYNWGENKERLRRIKNETGHKFAGWCFSYYPSTDPS